MIYYSLNKNSTEKKFRTNIQKDNINYSVVLSLPDPKKMQVTLKYSSYKSNEILEYINFYSLHQLQIINKYFKNFNNLEQICRKLDQLLKGNKINIEYKNDNLILSVSVFYNNESTKLIFKLRPNKVMEFTHNEFESRNKYPHLFSNKRNSNEKKKMLSMPKYNKYDTIHMKNLLNDLNERVTLLEDERSKGSNNFDYNEISRNAKKYKNNYNTVGPRNNEKYLVNTNNMNNLLNRLTKLEDSNYEKDHKIKNLESHLNKCEKSINTIISSPTYSLEHKSKTVSNFSEKISQKESNNRPLRNKRKQRQKLSSCDSKKNKSIDSSENFLGKNKEEEKKNDEGRRKKRNHKKSVNSSVSSSTSLKKSEQKPKKIKKKEEEIKNDNNGEVTRNIEINKDVSFDEEEKQNERIEEMNKEQMRKTGLPMPKREDIKKYINSRIFFTIKEMQTVKKKITGDRENLHACFEVLYRASIDGDFEDAITHMCEGIYPQLVLFYTQEGARFGVYINKEKKVGFFGGVTYKEIPGTSFLIGLNTLKIYDILPNQKATDDRPEKLCFGRSFYYNENNGTNWLIFVPKNLFLGVELKLGEKECNFGNVDPKDIIGIQKDYILEDVEIFKVIITDDKDDEKKKKRKSGA